MRRLSLAACLIALAACDRADENGARASQCTRFCEALEKCDDATDLLDCREQCEADDVRSDRYFRARAECGEKLSCSRWVQEVNTQGEDVCSADCNLLDCVDDALAEVKLNDVEKNVCMALGTKVNACDPKQDADLVIASCEQLIPVLSEAYRFESERCGAQPCAQIEACFDKLSDRNQTELELYSGTLP